MAPRIDHVGATREHGYRHAAASETAAVRGGVNAERQTAHNRYAGRSQASPEGVGDFAPVRTRVSRPDDGYDRFLAQTDKAPLTKITAGASASSSSMGG
jgi:hypothetical protein